MKEDTLKEANYISNELLNHIGIKDLLTVLERDKIFFSEKEVKEKDKIISRMCIVLPNDSVVILLDDKHLGLTNEVLKSVISNLNITLLTLSAIISKYKNSNSIKDVIYYIRTVGYNIDYIMNNEILIVDNLEKLFAATTNKKEVHDEKI